MTPRPKMPRNPYIGLDFKKHHLYQIYCHIRFQSSFHIPVYLDRFFKNQFNINPFREEMYTLLRDDAITSHLSDSYISVLYFDILNMINGNQKIFQNRKIRKNLERSDQIKVVKLLKPLLNFYLRGILSCNPFIKKKQWYLFKKGVKQFLRKHPTFGRLIKRKRCTRITIDLNYLAILRGVSEAVEFESESDESDVEMAVAPIAVVSNGALFV